MNTARTLSPLDPQQFLARPAAAMESILAVVCGGHVATGDACRTTDGTGHLQQLGAEVRALVHVEKPLLRAGGDLDGVFGVLCLVLCVGMAQRRPPHRCDRTLGRPRRATRACSR